MRLLILRQHILLPFLLFKLSMKKEIVEGVEGVIFHKYLWRDALIQFTNFIDVKLDAKTARKPLGIGNELTFRVDQIEIL
jgi:hypothetical protein